MSHSKRVSSEEGREKHVLENGEVVKVANQDPVSYPTHIKDLSGQNGA